MDLRAVTAIEAGVFLPPIDPAALGPRVGGKGEASPHSLPLSPALPPLPSDADKSNGELNKLKSLVLDAGAAMFDGMAKEKLPVGMGERNGKNVSF